MKRTGWKQLAVSIVGALLCKVSIMGCYPFVPAYFAAVYLQERARWLLPMGMLAGMAAFIPITAIAKYAMSMLIIVITVRLSEWVDKRCYTVAAAVAASGGTLALSVFGGVFDLRNQVTILSAVLEAIFIFGFCILAARGVHLFFEEKEQQAGYPAGTGSQKEQRLLNYAKSFEGLSKTFLAMDRQVKIGQEDVGQIQQEIAGRICSGCDTCSTCPA